MKNSLFKRAFAAAAVVPLALTQCLSVANAVYVNDSVVALTESKNLAADKTEITIDKIVSVEPGAGASSTGDGYIIYGADGDKITDESSVKENAVRFEKYSEWYDMVSEFILKIASGNESSGTIDLSEFYDAVVARAGNNAKTAKGVFEQIGEVYYNVDIEGNITITAAVNNITPVLTADGEKQMMDTLKKLADEYNAPELVEEDGFFDDVVIAGNITVNIDASDILMRGTSVVGEITFVDSQTGNTYKGSGVIDYAIERFEALDNAAKNKVAELKNKYDVDMTSVVKDIDDSLSFYVDKLEAAKEEIDEVLGLHGSGNFASYSEVAIWLNEKIDKKYNNKNIPTIPTTATGLMNNNSILKAYNNILNQLGQKAEGYDINVTADDLAEFIDGLSNISLTVDNGNVVIVGEFPDDESEEAWAYLKEKYDYDEQYTYESYKEVTLTVNFDTITNAGGGLADADLQFKRILEVEYDPNLTTTTTTSTTSTTTTTTSSDDDVTTTTTGSDDDVTTTTTGSGDDVTTTTTGSDDDVTTTTTGSDDDVTTTTTGSGDDVTTTTTTGSGDDVTTTTTGSGDDVTTTTTGSDDDVTTTTTGSGDDVTTTTTATMIGEDDGIVRAAIETEVVGFYFSHDPRPFKAENVNVERAWTKDAEGNEIDVEFDPSLVTFEEVNSKADNPEEAYDVNNTTFKYTVNVFYNGKPLVNADEDAVAITVYIGVKGDTNLDNMSDARDASNILAYYANASTLDEGETIEDVRMSPENCEPVNNNPELDTLCAFLADVDLDVYSKDNWRKTKSDRIIDATDASFILSYYSYMSTEENAIPHEGWNYSLESKNRGEKFDAYIESGKEV